MLAAKEVTFVPCSALFLDTWSMFRERERGGGLSFADSAIVLAARQERPGRVLTFDDGFRDVDGVTVLPS